jgi:hypothetical protein
MDDATRLRSPVRVYGRRVSAMSANRQIDLDIRIPEGTTVVIASPHTDDQVVADTSNEDAVEIHLPEGEEVPVSGGLRLRFNVIP